VGRQQESQRVTDQSAPLRDAASDTGRRLLVVDDDPQIRDLVARYLRGQGFTVVTAGDGEGLRREIAAGPVDAVLLDLGLPGEDGLDVARALREQWHGPIIIVSGRGEAVDRIVGLELGADDYVTKPFDLRELLARIRAVLRRAHAGDTPSPGVQGACLEFAGFRFDPLARSLHDASGAEVALTAGEYALLALFLQAPGRVLSRDYLVERLHGRSAGPYDRAIDVQVGRLRRKIEVDPAQPALIRAVRGSGYAFSASVRRA
jgi:DNA-binding response OmpR family regulator